MAISQRGLRENNPYKIKMKIMVLQERYYLQGKRIHTGQVRL